MANKITAYMQSVGTSLLIGSSLMLAGCVTATPPTDAMATADTAVNQAIDVKAAQHAPLELRLATEKLDRAQSALNEEDYTGARRLAEQAWADARLAEAQRKTAETEAERALKGRDKIVLEARTREADQAIPLAQQLAQDLADLAAQETERGLVLTLGDMLFDDNRASLKPGAQQHLYRLVTSLNEHPEQTVMIEGHTDSRDSDSYDLDLSERRARAAQDFVISNGIGPERITSRGLGEGYPLASNDTVAGRQQNRRVEIVLPASRQTGMEPPPEPGVAVQ